MNRVEPLRRVRCRIARERVAGVLVLCRDHAVSAIDAEGNVDYQCPAGHAAFSSLVSHFSTSTQQLLGTIPSAVVLIFRPGVRRLRQPPRSTNPTDVWIRSSSPHD